MDVFSLKDVINLQIHNLCTNYQIFVSVQLIGLCTGESQSDKCNQIQHQKSSDMSSPIHLSYVKNFN